MKTICMIVAMMLSCSTPQGSSGTEKAIQTKVGDTFSLELPSQVATGYRWKLADSLDTALLTLEETTYKETSEELDGRTGRETWTFKAQAKGKTSIHLVYTQPWLTDLPADAERKSYEVIIE